jgi:serine/threonine protein kinase
MSLASGTRVGPYDIVGPLGVGGMGEVYRARDRRLSRDVAVKLLPESFAADPERVTRFTREAHLLAAMNHPNIAHMYGVEEIERQSGPASAALIMELVVGTTLADRLAEGPLPTVEAIAIARQIAEALEYAHDHGVVHRDLKPANVKLRGDGVVKVLDFGLARALVPGTAVPDVSASPTELALVTEAGVILGTAAYMSPEQARGRAVDRRADIWSFGVVLFEMLAGRRVFDGTAATEIIAAVIRDDPPWDALPPATPQYLRALLERCLERDVRRRLRDIGEARIVLEQPPAMPPIGVPSEVPANKRRGSWWPAIAALLFLGWIGTAAWLSRPATVAPAPPLQFAIPLASSVAGLNHQNLTLALAMSPDGQHVATVGPEGIWLWSASSGAARLVEDTVGAAAPFFSADGNHIGFFAREELRRVAVAGGPASLITRAASGNAGTWAADDTILYNIWIGPSSGLWQVSGRGGEPRLIEAAKDPASLRAYPSYLPDGRHYLFTLGSIGGDLVGKRQICIGSTNDQTVDCVAAGDSNAVYSASGHLVFIRGGTLVALPFDVERRTPSGEAATLARGTRWFGPVGIGMFAVSADGRSLVYQKASRPRRLVLVDRTGRELNQVAAPGMYNLVQLSPDGKRVAADVWNDSNGGRDLWTIDVATGVSTRLTFDPLDVYLGSWAPHGRALVYGRPATGPPDIFEIDADGGGTAPRPIFEAPGVQLAQHWSSAGDLAFLELWPNSADQRNVWLLSKDGKARRFRQTPANTFDPRFSPDGRLLAYASDESGQPEIYVAPLNGATQPRRLSRAGGFSPRWRGDGGELYFLQADGTLMTVNPRAEVATPAPLFRIDGVSAADRYSPPRERNVVFDVMPDGQRFLLRLPDTSDPRGDDLRVMVNWAPARRD